MIANTCPSCGRAMENGLLWCGHCLRKRQDARPISPLQVSTLTGLILTMLIYGARTVVIFRSAGNRFGDGLYTLLAFVILAAAVDGLGFSMWDRSFAPLGRKLAVLRSIAGMTISVCCVIVSTARSLSAQPSDLGNVLLFISGLCLATLSLRTLWRTK